jgi:hypothetical protein
MTTPSDVTALDTIIKEVAEAGKGGNGEHYIAIRTNTGEIVSPDSWSFRGGPKRIYRVFTDDAGQPRADGRSNTITVRDPESGDSVNLYVSYQASCPKGKAETLVSALGRKGSPDDDLKRRISAVADDFLFRRERQFFTNFDKLRGELTQRIEDMISTDTGLNFRPHIQFAREYDLSPERVAKQIEVRFIDSTEPQTVSFECHLDVVPELTLRAIVSAGKFNLLHSQLVGAVADHFRLHVNVEEYALGFATSQVSDGLRVALNALTSRYGRQINGLTLKSQKGPGYIPPNFIEDTIDIAVQPLGRVEPITLTSRMQMSRADLAKFQKRRISDLTAWIKEALDNVVHVVCFDRVYLEYVQPESWKDIEAQIKEKMVERAGEIGYDVKQIFSAPRLKEWEFADPKYHRFELSDLPLRSTARAHVDLTVAATFFIKDWGDSKIVQKINQGIDLGTDIERELRQTLSSVLAEVSPNDFILKFSERNAENGSTEDKLRTAVEKTLIDKYQAGVSSVIVTPVDNDEIGRVRGLLNVPKILQFTAKPLAGPEEMSFSVSWRVCDIESDSWNKVSRSTCNLDAIEKSLISALEASFNGVAPQLLYARTSGELKQLGEEAFKQPKKEIVANFGVGIDLSNLNRAWTSSEERRREIWLDLDNVKRDLHRQDIDKEKRIGKITTDREVRRYEELAASAEAEFRRLTFLREQPKLSQEERDERARLEKTFRELNDTNFGSVRKLPSFAELTDVADPSSFQSKRYDSVGQANTIEARAEAVVDQRDQITLPPGELLELDGVLLDHAARTVAQDPDIQGLAEVLSIDAAGGRLRSRLEVDGDASTILLPGWDQFKDEFFLLFCTRQRKYDDLRKKIKSTDRATRELVIPAIAGAIGAALGIGASILTPFVALALLGVAELGINAWCARSSGRSQLAFSSPDGKPLKLRRGHADHENKGSNGDKARDSTL